jgi:hypothetical protein
LLLRYEQSLAIRRELLGESHPSVGSLLANMAAVHLSKGRHADAVALFTKSLATFTDNPRQTAIINTNLGEMLFPLSIPKWK